jgi:hypothetical protein
VDHSDPAYAAAIIPINWANGQIASMDAPALRKREGLITVRLGTKKSSSKGSVSFGATFVLRKNSILSGLDIASPSSDNRQGPATHTTRMALIWLSRRFDWRQVLAMGQPATLIRWHRQGVRLFWRWKANPGRPRIPADLQALIRRIARQNPLWGEERIANELLLKLGIRVSPRTVRQYIPMSRNRPPRPGAFSQRWRTFVRNHAKMIIACDFCVVVTATFRRLYVFVVIEHATRRILHINSDGASQRAMDRATAHHLQRLLHEWVCRYNEGRPHMALGPSIPQPPPHLPVPPQVHRHRIPEHPCMVPCPVLGGLHHENRLEERTA